MADDVVAELDEWLEREAATLKHYPADDVDTGLLQRARDEIVALRKLTDGDWVWQQITSTRDEALEEAARLHEDIDPACDHERQKGDPGGGAMGAVIRYRDAIRALKEERSN